MATMASEQSSVNYERYDAKESAFKLWKLIPALACNSESKFSSGWFDGFKKCYNIKKHKERDEAG